MRAKLDLWCAVEGETKEANKAIYLFFGVYSLPAGYSVSSLRPLFQKW